MKNLILILAMSFLFNACDNQQTTSNKEPHKHEENINDVIELTNEQFEALEIELDTLRTENLGKSIDVIGELTVPPAHEAKITAKIAGNIDDILVLEGDEVKQNQIVAYLSHPDIIEFQVKYIKLISQLEYLESEYLRQKKLYESEIKSGREFQKIKADYLSMKAEVDGYQEKLDLIGINANNIKDGKIYKRIPVKSPLSGFVFKINAKRGQYLNTDTEILKVINNDHIHADVMVFEKDAKNIKIGQKVIFETDYNEGMTYSAEIYSVGKIFEKEPKAIHVHAEINQEKIDLIPGAYIKGQVITDSIPVNIISEDGLIMKDDKNYIFMYIGKHQSDYQFKPIEVLVEDSYQGKFAIKIMEKISPIAKFAQNAAYYIESEMRKSEGGHGHHH